MQLFFEHRWYMLVRPGRIHHCMRSIGVAQKALDTMLLRVTDPSRKTFGKFLYEHGKLICRKDVLRAKNCTIGTVVADIAKSRAEIESARLLVLSAALQIDKFKAKGALKEIGIAKVSFLFVSLRCGILTVFSSWCPPWPYKS